jgi:hypothetical protein
MKNSDSTLQARVNKILNENGLDFHILKVPFFGELPSSKNTNKANRRKNNKIVGSDYFGLFNTKTREIIHSVKGSYTVSQNKDIVEMVLRGAEPFGELSVSKAGSLHEGRKVFIQLALDGFASVGNDKIKRYITIIDSNDGSTGMSVGIGDFTASCSNEFYKFYKEGTMRAMHKASISEKIKELPYLIKDALSESMRLIELYNKFQSTECSRELAHQMVNHLLGYDRTSPDSVLNELKTRSMNAMDSLYNSIHTEMNGKGNNLWGLHSGVTRWTTHEKSAPRRENGRLESIMMGTNYKVNQKSLAFASELL